MITSNKKGGMIMKEAIDATKDIITKQVEAQKIFMFGVPFSEYQRVYKETNENIDGYMRLLDFQGKESALTVLASGDHVFNLIYYGIMNIDSFDTNKLTEYYALGIKKSAILAFPYFEYLRFMRKIMDPDISLDELNALIKSLFPFMDQKNRIFWKEIISYNYVIQKRTLVKLNLFHMILINIGKEYMGIAKNTYLKSEENYEQLRQKLALANITFQSCNCLQLENSVSSKYDYLFLSNIPDYFDKSFGNFWEYEKLKDYEDSLANIMNEEGTIALAYLIKCYSINRQRFNTYPILSSHVKITDLETEEVITFPHILNGEESKVVKDGMILKRII